QVYPAVPLCRGALPRRRYRACIGRAGTPGPLLERDSRPGPPRLEIGRRNSAVEAFEEFRAMAGIDPSDEVRALLGRFFPGDHLGMAMQPANIAAGGVRYMHIIRAALLAERFLDFQQQGIQPLPRMR